MKRMITMIKAQKRKGRYNVYINGRYAFPMSEQVMVKYHVFKGKLISKDLQKQLMIADRTSKLYDRAIQFVTRHLRTEREVDNLLSAKTDNQLVIDLIIRKLKSLHLVNDQHYANCYVQTELINGHRGPLMIERKLKLKGVATDLIQRALQKFYPHSRVIENGLQQARKLFHRHRDAFRNNLQKTKAGLVRKGYSFDEVEQIMKRAHFQPDLSAQHRLLVQKAKLAWRRYSRDPTSVRRYKAKEYLYRKGFSFDEIDLVLENLLNKE